MIRKQGSFYVGVVNAVLFTIAIALLVIVAIETWKGLMVT